jgi:aryl-alcohol dehydrogenase-like predicted oxidoreductase
VPIPGTRKLERVEENLGAADVALTAEDHDEIEATASRITVQGAPLPEAILQLSYR